MSGWERERDGDEGGGIRSAGEVFGAVGDVL